MSPNSIEMEKKIIKVSIRIGMHNLLLGYNSYGITFITVSNKRARCQ